MSVNKLLQRVYLNNTSEGGTGTERSKICKSIKDSTKAHLIRFLPEKGRDHYHHSFHLLNTPRMQSSAPDNTFYSFLQRNEDTSSPASTDQL